MEGTATAEGLTQGSAPQHDRLADSPAAFKISESNNVAVVLRCVSFYHDVRWSSGSGAAVMGNPTASWVQRFSRRGVVSVLCVLILGIEFIGSSIAQNQGPVLNSPRARSPGETRTIKWNSEVSVSTYAGRQGDLECSIVKSSNLQSTVCNTIEGNSVRRVGSWRPAEFTPHSGLVSFPLFIGKQWEHSYTYTVPGGQAINQIRRASVVSFEKVTVPAGTFDAFKIQSSRTIWGDRPGRTISEIYYYSDKIGFIKLESDFDHLQLLDYSPK